MAGLDGKELTAALKIAKKKPRNYLFAAGSKLEEHYLFLSKKRIPKSMMKEAKAASKSPKAYLGTCEYDKDSGVLVFETDKPFADKQVKGLRNLVKKRGGLKSLETELKQVAAIKEMDFDDDDDDSVTGDAPAGPINQEEEESMPAGAASQQAPEPQAAPAVSSEKFLQAEAAWNKTRELLSKDVDKLKKAIVTEMRGVDDTAGLVKSVKQLDSVLDKLGDDLSKTLKQAANAGGDEAAKFQKQAMNQINDYARYVKTDPMVKGLDSNPFTKVNIKKAAQSALDVLEKTLSK